MMKANNVYTNNEFNRNYKKFQKAAILFWNAGQFKPQSHTQQMKFWENTKRLHQKIKIHGMMI
jgi:hypothetical protein